MIVLNKLVRNLRIDRQFLCAEALVAVSFGDDDESVPFVSVEKISYGFGDNETADEISQNILAIAVERAYKNIPRMIAHRTIA